MEIKSTAALTQIQTVRPAKTMANVSPQAPVATSAPTESANIASHLGAGQASLGFLENDPFQQAFAKLPPQAQQQFNELMDQQQSVFQTPELNPPRPGNPLLVPSMPLIDNTRRAALPPQKFIQSAFSPEEKAQLQNLLSNGTLMQKSRDGKTILEHLQALAKDDNNRQTDGVKLVKELIRMLQPEDLQAAFAAADKMEYIEKKGKQVQKGVALPGGLGEITQCVTHYTCGAASAQVMLHMQQPAELVRILHDLVSKGKAELHNGKSLRPAEGSLDYHAGDKIYAGELKFKKAGVEDRTDSNIILQSAIMNKTSLGNWSEYDVDSDSGGLFNTLQGNSGSHPLYVGRTLEELTGQPYTYEHTLNPYNLGGFARFFGNLNQPVSQTELVNSLKTQLQNKQTSMIAYQTNPDDAMSLHYVTVVNYNPQTDTYYYVDTGEPREERAKIYTKTGAEMQNVLRCVIHPQTAHKN